MIRHSLAFSLALAACTLAGSVSAGEPCVSGLNPGQRPGPYAALVSVGPNRGQLHCFICETEDRPAAIVFARKPTATLAKLLQGFDRAVVANKAVEMRSWATFLSEDQTVLDPQLVKWAKESGLSNVSLAVFEDRDGPPAYRLSSDAEVTVLLFVKQKVVRNFAFRSGELNDKAVAEVLKAIPAIIKGK
jgi:hypothetical protein